MLYTSRIYCNHGEQHEQPNNPSAIRNLWQLRALQAHAMPTLGKLGAVADAAYRRVSVAQAAQGAQMKFRKGSGAWKVKRAAYWLLSWLFMFASIGLILFVAQILAPLELARFLAGAAFLQVCSQFMAVFAEEER